MQKHERIAFRRVAAKLYKKNLKWRKAVNMATGDSLYTDAMETAAQSASRELVAELLTFFVEEAKDQHSFAACLFTCQGLVGFHTALEMAWLNQEALPGILSLCMPFFVACIREYTGKVRLPSRPPVAANCRLVGQGTLDTARVRAGGHADDGPGKGARGGGRGVAERHQQQNGRQLAHADTAHAHGRADAGAAHGLRARLWRNAADARAAHGLRAAAAPAAGVCDGAAAAAHAPSVVRGGAAARAGA